MDASRTTLGDVVEILLRSQFRYGEEFVVNNEVGTLYDVDETENLDRRLSELGREDLALFIVLANCISQVSRTVAF